MSASKKKKAKPKVKKAPARKPAEPKVSKTKKAAKAAVEEEKPKKPAPKPKKEVERTEAPPKVVARAEPVRLGTPPGAVVTSRHLDSGHERAARGFSFGELDTAGVPLNIAKREGLSVDIRRRTVLEGNVDALKGWLKSPAGKKK